MAPGSTHPGRLLFQDHVLLTDPMGAFAYAKTPGTKPGVGDLLWNRD
jgi:hypothetical protein